eukprot:3820144-Prymnesium_polylepis.1
MALLVACCGAVRCISHACDERERQTSAAEPAAGLAQLSSSTGMSQLRERLQTFYHSSCLNPLGAGCEAFYARLAAAVEALAVDTLPVEPSTSPFDARYSERSSKG